MIDVAISSTATTETSQVQFNLTVIICSSLSWADGTYLYEADVRSHGDDGRDRTDGRVALFKIDDRDVNSRHVRARFGENRLVLIYSVHDAQTGRIGQLFHLVEVDSRL
jgi:hypothetical protein